jgi:hypothetical protein
MCFLCDCGLFGRRAESPRAAHEAPDEQIVFFQPPQQGERHQHAADDSIYLPAGSYVPRGPVQQYPEFDYRQLQALQGRDHFIMTAGSSLAQRQFDLSGGVSVSKAFVSVSPALPDSVKQQHTLPFIWKFHISIDEESENLEKGWNIIKDILITRAVASFKVLHPDETLVGSGGQEGKQVTIYASCNTNYTAQDWQGILTEIETALLAASVKQGPSCKQRGAKPERAVEGSQYIYFRLDVGDHERNALVYDARIDHLRELGDGFRIEMPESASEMCVAFV